jgi:hypothetical protein
VAFIWTALAWQTVSAQEIGVPARLQIDLLNKVVTYDRNFIAHAAQPLGVVVLIKAGDADSERVGAQLMGELRGRSSLGKLAHRATLVRYANPKALADLCRMNRVSILYLSTGFGSQVSAIADALRGVPVLSVTASDDDVKRGIVLGFGVRSGKPKLLIHLGRARSQGVDFRADLLRIAEVVSS